ncbi:MAG TPA: hypothetical protein VMW28_05680 [Pelolinea sp.]|nr:hypothetical protein [Pelolinea sp.]
MQHRELFAPGGSEVNPAAKRACYRIFHTSIQAEAPRWSLLSAGL